MIVPKDDERKKAQKATKPAFGLGNVSVAKYKTNIFCILTFDNLKMMNIKFNVTFKLKQNASPIL